MKEEIVIVALALLIIVVFGYTVIKEKYDYPDKDYAYAIQNDIPYPSVMVTPGYENQTPGLGWLL
jgi:hypothetical protein